MYVLPNFTTKKELKEAAECGEFISLWDPGPVDTGIENGIITVEGPHYPKPHKWYAEVTIEDGQVVRVT